MASNRSWMYDRLVDGFLCDTFSMNVEEFINFALEHDDWNYPGHLKCPCIKCKNIKFQLVETVKLHLCKEGFVPNYWVWKYHGEPCADEGPSKKYKPTDVNPLEDMVIDAFGPAYGSDRLDEHDNEPPPASKEFFEMLNSAKEPLYPGCKLSQLSAVSRLLNIKCEYNIPHRATDAMAALLKDVCPDDNVTTDTLYSTNKLMKGIRLPVHKIDVCPNGCMLFWKDDAHLALCSHCGASRYKEKHRGKKRVALKVLRYFPIAPRLQRLYATKNTAKAMSWHASNQSVEDFMSHPSDSDAWKHLDREFPDFSAEPRNVRLGLCTDGFAPFGKSGKDYSCWPVILTPYNLPPGMCMKTPYMMLSLIIPGPKSPKGNIDVYLQPLIEELSHLWSVGAPTFDVYNKQTFQMKAALLWTISDFPAYGMLSGWSTAGRLSCPYCMEGSKSFTLKYGRKQTWFDCHRRFLPSDHPFRENKSGFLKNKREHDVPIPLYDGDEMYNRVFTSSADEFHVTHSWSKQSIFWQLPYWSKLLIRHNLDVMHIEKNVFDNVFNTVMDVKGKTKDTTSARKDLKLYCKRPSLQLVKRVDKKGVEQTYMPEAPYVLKKDARKVLCEWIEKLKFADGYASNLRRCIREKEWCLKGMKSHDCHVFMERLLPVVFKELLPGNVWKILTELSQFFRDLCSNSVRREDMERLERYIPEILCKLERLLPPAFFNCMEHLPIHLPHEAKIAGPVHYRWMYPFERFLFHLKGKIGNKAHVEGSICEAYLMEEQSNFCVNYFGSDLDTKAKDPPRNCGVSKVSEVNQNLPQAFSSNGGYAPRRGKKDKLSQKDSDVAHRYILDNSEIMAPFERLFEQDMLENRHASSTSEVWSKKGDMWPTWLQDYVLKHNTPNEMIRTFALGPALHVQKYHQFCINGYLFDTYAYGSKKATSNYGVSVKGHGGKDYYGILQEIIELQYVGSEQSYRSILFKCDWFDSEKGTSIHENYQLVEVDKTKRYKAYDPFVFAHQAQQVCYTPYPSLRKESHWWAVFKMKARGMIDSPHVEVAFQEDIGRTLVSLSIPEPEHHVEEDEHEEEEEDEQEDDVEDEHDDVDLDEYEGVEEDVVGDEQDEDDEDEEEDEDDDDDEDEEQDEDSDAENED